MAEVLDTGPPRRRRRPRWVATATPVAVVAAAAVLAVRSGPDRPATRPAPAPAPATVAAEPFAAAVVSVAAGTRWLYALVAECTEQATVSCSYTLHRRPVDGADWTPMPLRTGPRVVGIPPSVQVTADGTVVVLETPVRSRLYVSTDDGETFSWRELTPGPAARRAPADGLVTIDLCLDCGDGLVLLEPGTGTLRRLATQPPFGGLPVRSFGQHGAVLWALATDRAATTGAVSADGGRSWRTAPVPVSAGALRLQVTADGGAYVLASERTTNGTERLTGVLRADRPGGGWRRLPAAGPRSVHSAAVGPDGLLVVDWGGTVWRLGPAGFDRLPDPGPSRPGRLVAGPTGVLVAVPRGDIPDQVVLTSTDGGATWRTEQVVG